MTSENQSYVKQLMDVIETVCATGHDGIAGIGAHAAISAMLPYWQAHFEQEWPATIIQADIASTIVKLQDFSTAIRDEIKQLGITR